MRVTLKDIANDLGLAVITVSKVLRNHTDIKPATRERVLKRVKELNYQPNRAARSLVTGRSSTIAFVVPDLEHPFFGEIAKAIAGKLRLRDYSLFVACTEEDPEIETREIDALLARQVDAIILASVQASARSSVFQQLRDSRVPFVLIDRNFSNLSANYIGVDDYAIGRAATEHLISIGRRRIAHLSRPKVSTGIGRLRGYRKALEDHKISSNAAHVISLESGDNCAEDAGFAAMNTLLRRRPCPDAVFCYNDEVAIGALRATLAAGLAIPRDIAIIGVDNIRYADLLRVPLSSIDQNSYEIGERAADLVLSLIEAKKPIDSIESLVPIRLVVRESTVSAQK
jgi:LacI family transcriptional regulator